MDRDKILDTAKSLVGGPRKAEYGDLKANFETCADLWGAYLKGKYGFDQFLDVADVAVMNAIIKIARIANNPVYADGWIDIAGYAALGGELTTGSTNDR